MKTIILNNLGLKVLALLLAVVTWAYVVIELQQGATDEKEMLQSILPSYRLSSKKVPVKLNLTGQPREGYIVAYDRVVMRPSEIFMVGPKSVLEKLQSIETEPVDISNYSKTVIKDISIVPPTKGMIEDKFISLTIPILKEN